MVRRSLAASALSLSFFVLVAAPAEGVPILVNGSFEIGPPPFSVHDIDILPGSTAITGWLVTGRGIDLLEDPWDVSDGLRAIDLDGRSPGGIQQTFATAVGHRYEVTFDVSGNPGGGPLLKQFLVTAGDFAGAFNFETTGQQIDALLWETITFSFVASAHHSTLGFASLSPVGNAYGALIDNVSVSAIPEPTTLGLVVLGAVLALPRRGRRG